VPIAVGDIEFEAPFATAIDLVSVSSIASGSSASNTSVTLGQAQLVLGRTLGITVASRGEQDVSGTASNTVIASGGLQLVFSGGTASGGGTIDHGIQYVFAGGSASGTLVASDGTQGDYGTAISTTVSGVQYVGGMASATTVAIGATEYVVSGGTAVNTTDDWLQWVSGGGTPTRRPSATAAPSLSMVAPAAQW
jgi:autotransporter passenger strand-loop-strand repeat protein